MILLLYHAVCLCILVHAIYKISYIMLYIISQYFILCILVNQTWVWSFCSSQYIAVHIIPDQMMMFGGKADPCALCSLHSIGKIGGSQNKQYSKLLMGLLNKHLGISPDRYTHTPHSLKSRRNTHEVWWVLWSENNPC